MVVTASDVRNPNTGPATLLWTKGSWTFFKLNSPRNMIIMAMVIRSALGLAEFKTRTPMGVAAIPPKTRPRPALNSRLFQVRASTIIINSAMRLFATTTTC